MKGLTSRWSFRLTGSGDLPPAPGQPIPPAVSGPGVAPIVGRLLISRGFERAEAAADFLDPKLRQLHDPSLMPDLDRAAERLVDAAKAGESIVIYGDYDVDGITATAILFHTIRTINPGANVRSYVPHRLEEGYGLNAEAIAELCAAGARVIVSVDCGVTAVGPAEVARAAGVDLIITDHHNPPETMDALPRAFAVVHPRRPDSKYPFGELSGAGVAYKLAWRMCTIASGGTKCRDDLRALLLELLAFAAIGAVADIVPLVGENRVLTRFGLPLVEKSKFEGLSALVKASGLLEQKIGAMEVGFRIGPRLNAAGRMGHAKEAMELFTTAAPDRAREIAKHLGEQNELRRSVEKAILDQAVAMAEKSGMTRDDRRAIVLAHESWHAGVVGIVCSRLVERFHRPTILMQTRDGSCHGSGRSVDGFNLHAGLVECHEHLDRYGGHNMAAGVHIAEPKLSAFVEKFTDVANRAIEPARLCARVEIDCEAAADELTVDAVRQVERLGPFGAGNPEPSVLVRDLVISGRAALGAQGKHAKLELRTADGRRVFRAVGWGWGEHLPGLAPGVKLDAVMTPRVSTFTGTPVVEPELCDVMVR